MMTIDAARQQLCDFINYRKPVNMSDVHTTFVIERMRMDKFFSEFLEQTELEMSSDDTFSGPAWQTYKAKLKEYATLEQFIKQSQYYLNKNV
jgi:hypothetical protein